MGWKCPGQTLSFIIMVGTSPHEHCNEQLWRIQSELTVRLLGKLKMLKMPMMLSMVGFNHSSPADDYAALGIATMRCSVACYSRVLDWIGWMGTSVVLWYEGSLIFETGLNFSHGTVDLMLLPEDACVKDSLLLFSRIILQFMKMFFCLLPKDDVKDESFPGWS